MAMDPATHLLALQHFEAGRFDEAAVLCDRILSEQPNDWMALRLLGGVRIKQGNFAQAAQLLTTALQTVPANDEYVASMLVELAEALQGQDDLAGALQCYEQAL